MTAVALENVSRAFGQVLAVDRISLKVEAGEFLTLLGPSGCGKTTTLRMIAGLEENTTGRITIGNTVVSDAERLLFVAAERQRLGITSLYVTHDQEEAMALSDRVVVMEAGKILQVGPPEEIYQRPTSRSVAAFFGSPNLLSAEVTACQPADNGFFQLDVNGQD